MSLIRITIALLGLIIVAATSADPRTTNDAVYYKAQAKVGEQLYKDHCLICHDKKYFRPIFKTWDGQSLGVLNTVMSASMPESNPGALPQQDYVDILAYVLSLNRYPAGDANLSDENGALNEITIAQRRSAAAK